MRICDTCGGLIEGGAQKITIDSPSGAAPDVYVHPYACKASPPRQTYPAATER
jgi:hypothetical protein